MLTACRSLCPSGRSGVGLITTGGAHAATPTASTCGRVGLGQSAGSLGWFWGVVIVRSSG
jgi:hypothetical protein